MTSERHLDIRRLPAGDGGVEEWRVTLDRPSGAVPGLFFVPSEPAGAPLVVIQHPGMSSKDDYFVRDVARMWAARHGWICGGIDAPYHGERDPSDPMKLFRERELMPIASAQFTADLRAMVDALCGELAPDTQAPVLGYCGFSLGSMLGIPAVAADGRYRAASFCLIGEGGLAGAADDPGGPIARLGGCAVRIVAKTADEFFPRATTEALVAGLPGEKDVVWLPGGHFEIGPDVIAAAEEWLVQKLG